jgi:hypothetical protein
MRPICPISDWRTQRTGPHGLRVRGHVNLQTEAAVREVPDSRACLFAQISERLPGSLGAQANNE